ncbi:hypothetical protein [Sphingomonas phyllosphaerae]|uniref:hypothetical protein n=1 Tax=Sphingomonas phyllosphaerae TaxID=257003 RepID=UPI00040F954F|nr:hypothetical protein [Sphingomonas phyllosphaerae]
MKDTLDHHGVNHMLVSIAREMAKDTGKKPADADTIFMGGTTPTEADQKSLADFALAKNYNMLFSAFDPEVIGDGPVTMLAVITDGEAKAAVLPDGRLWKKDRRSPAIIVFAELNAVVRMSTKGRLIVREMTGSYHEEGFAIAMDAVRAAAERKPAHAPIISTIGNLMIIMDVETMMMTTLQAV